MVMLNPIAFFQILHNRSCPGQKESPFMRYLSKTALLFFALLTLGMPALAEKASVAAIGKCTDSAKDVADVNVLTSPTGRYLVIGISNTKGQRAVFTVTKKEVDKIVDLGGKAANDKETMKPGDRKLYGAVPGTDGHLSFMRVVSMGKTQSAMVIKSPDFIAVFLLTPQSWGQLQPLIRLGKKKL